MSRDLPTGTVTFLFTDIEGSTRLLRELGPDRYAEALAEHRRVLRDSFAAEGGVEVDTQGDAFFVAFPTAAGAIAAAASGQQALATGPITVRMGLHTGTPTVTAEGYVGNRRPPWRAGRRARPRRAGDPLRCDRGARRGSSRCAISGAIESRTSTRRPGSSSSARPSSRRCGRRERSTSRHPRSSFLGREDELFEAATSWLDRDPRVLTIVGPGGAGKTRFAIELARFLAEDADGGTVFVPLAPVRDPTLVVPTIAGHLGASGGGAQPRSPRGSARSVSMSSSTISSSCCPMRPARLPSCSLLLRRSGFSRRAASRFASPVRSSSISPRWMRRTPCGCSSSALRRSAPMSRIRRPCTS